MSQLKIDFDNPASQARGLLDEQERRVLFQINRGRQHAISSRKLQVLCDMSDVMVRQTIKHLVEDHGCLIVSATGKPNGFYIPVTREESRQGFSQLAHRLVSLARRMRALDKAAYDQLCGQLKLEDLEAVGKDAAS